MQPRNTNRILIWLIIILLVADAATVAYFWLGNSKGRPSQESPKEFIIRELSMDANQQKQYSDLVTEHRASVDSLRQALRTAKDSFFELIKEPAVTDSAKQAAVSVIGRITESIDLRTLEHFQKVRMLCRPEQQEKFDRIIHQVMGMMGPPPPGGPPGPGRRPGP
jgi:protein CpxP